MMQELFSHDITQQILTFIECLRNGGLLIKGIYDTVMGFYSKIKLAIKASKMGPYALLAFGIDLGLALFCSREDFFDAVDDLIQAINQRNDPKEFWRNIGSFMGKLGKAIGQSEMLIEIFQKEDDKKKSLK